MPIRPAIELPPTLHDDDAALVDPGVWSRDGGVSSESLLPECLLGVAVDARSSEAACVDAEEDIADGFESSEGGVVCPQGDWMVG